MNRILAARPVFLALSIMILAKTPIEAVDPARSDPPEDCSVHLEAIRKKHDLPAMGVIAVVDGKVRAVGATGLRKAGGDTPVTADDKWHIGSCTKSMTATLAATFVEEGKLTWDSTVGEILGKGMGIRDDYAGVTLGMLVTNRSGIPGKPPGPIWGEAWKGTGKSDVRKRRKAFAMAMLNEKPEFEPGTDFAYSNSGFVVAGVMLETVANETWEALMEKRIFEPLGMKSAGFGCPATGGKVDQPWGHHTPDRPQEPGIRADNPDVIGPAGTVHASLADIAKYAAMHATRKTGPVIKEAETYTFLHSIPEGNRDYAAGWLRVERPWAQGAALTHNGSNTMNYCVIWLAPERQFAGIAVSNIGVQTAAGGCDEAIANLVGVYLR